MLKTIKRRWKQAMNDPRANFRISIAFRFTLIPLVSLAITYFLNYMTLNNVLISFQFFKSDKDFIVRDLLNLFITDALISLAPWAMLYIVLVFIVGLMIAKTVLRPFDVIENYCESQLRGDKGSYDPEFSVDLKLLSSFSDWFFSTINVIEKTGGNSIEVEVPHKYKKIHKPVFETAFFLNYLLVVICFSIITAIGIYYGSSEIFESVIKVISEVYPSEVKLNTIASGFYEVFWTISNFVIVLSTFFYIYFLMTLYSRISTPAFGVFATMRSFISGKKSSRVHLIGFPYIRNQTRMLNKYLDHVERNLGHK